MKEYKIAREDIITYHLVHLCNGYITIDTSGGDFYPNELVAKNNIKVYPNHRIKFFHGYVGVLGENYGGEWLQCHYADYIAKFIIPKGTKYYNNTDEYEGYIETDKLIWTGCLASRREYAKKYGCIYFDEIEYKIHKFKTK